MFTSRSHQEATARSRRLIEEQAIGVMTGEVGAGKTFAAALDASHIVYLANPMVGAGSIHHHVVTALGETPGSTGPPSSPRPPTCSPPNTTSGAST